MLTLNYNANRNPDLDTGNLNDLMNDESDLFLGHSHLTSCYRHLHHISPPAKPCLSICCRPGKKFLHIYLERCGGWSFTFPMFWWFEGCGFEYIMYGGGIGD